MSQSNILGLAFLLAGQAFPLVTGGQPQAINVPLLIDKPKGLETKVWPLTVGVPFPEGLVRDLSNLSILDKEGRLVPSQFTGVSSWDDKSVRWALADFLADLSSSYRVGEGRPHDPAAPVEVESHPKSVIWLCI